MCMHFPSRQFGRSKDDNLYFMVRRLFHGVMILGAGLHTPAGFHDDGADVLYLGAEVVKKYGGQLANARVLVRLLEELGPQLRGC